MRLMIIFTGLLALTTSCCLANSSQQQQQNIRLSSNLRRVNKIRQDPDFKENEIMYNEDQPDYLLPEPYKSIAQTTTRFALAQAALPEHVTIEGAMSVLNDAFYMLARKEVLMKVFKVLSTLIASSLGAALLAPDLMRVIWRQPSKILDLDQHLHGGFSEARVMQLANSTSEQVFQSVGLEARVCRERSVCYMGEILHCWLPRSSEAIIRFAKRNFAPNSGQLFRSHPLGRAFLLGFVDRNCSSIEGPPMSVKLQPATSSSSSHGSDELAARSMTGSSSNGEESVSCLRSFLASLFGSSSSASSISSREFRSRK